MRYRNFDLKVRAGPDGRYVLEATCGDHGEWEDVMAQDPAGARLRECCTSLAGGPGDEALLVEVGGLLYTLLFRTTSGRIETFLQRCWGLYVRDGGGLRIRLVVEPGRDALRGLPWELAYSTAEKRFLATSLATPLVRYVELARDVGTLETTRPVRVLVVAPPAEDLESAKEVEILHAALADLEARGDLQLEILATNVTTDEISAAAVRLHPQIVHFIGHGGVDAEGAYVSLEGDEPVGPQVFAGLFEEHPPKLVVLNSCEGAREPPGPALVAMAEQLVQIGVPAVIAMRYKIDDPHAILFAREFYTYLLTDRDNGGRVDAAMTRARGRLADEFPGDRVLGSPVLYLRAEEGVLFDFVGRGRVRDLPLTPGQRETAAAAQRTEEEGLRILEAEARVAPPDGAVRTAVAERRDELARLTQRIRLRDRIVWLSVAVALLIGSALWLGLASRLPAWMRAESYGISVAQWLTDPPVSDDIAVVFIDRRTERSLRAPFGPDWRRHHATLLDRLSEAGVRAVAFDMYFSRETPHDAALAAAIRRAQERGTRVVLGVRDASDGEPVIAPALRETGAAWGILCVGIGDSPLPLRSAEHAIVVLRKPGGGRPFPGLGVATVAAATGSRVVFDEREAHFLSADESRLEPIRFSEVHTIEANQEECGVMAAGDRAAAIVSGYASAEALRSPERRLAYEELLDPLDPRAAEGLRGKIVMIGVENEAERFRVRRGLGVEDLYGVDLHADAVNSILLGVAPRPLGDLWQIMVVFLMALAGCRIAMARLPGRLGATRVRRILARGFLLFAAVVVLLGVVVFLYGAWQLVLLAGYQIAALFLAFLTTWWVRRRLAPMKLS